MNMTRESPEELKCIELMKILLATDKSAVFRILRTMKDEIYKEEAKVRADEIIRRAMR